MLEIESTSPFYRSRGFQHRRRPLLCAVPAPAKNALKLPRVRPSVSGTLGSPMHWQGNERGIFVEPRVSWPRSWRMRNKIFAIVAIAGALGVPVAAQAGEVITTGVARGAAAVGDVEGITADQRPAFREYIVRERVPTYTVPERIVVGSVLPEVGITYYDVPQSFGATPYRYTVVNGRTVLVEPRSRRIVQVVE
jgi:Protein of unknown function (DUF1236)